MIKRKPAVAGMFYPLNPNDLMKMIEWCINHDFGPKEVKPKDVIAAVSPHAGYVYSGPCAAWTYSRISKNKTFVIIGPNHTGYGYGFSIMTSGTWETPLGEAYIDEDIAKEILEVDFVKEDVFAHLYEHSIEVQLPFLQYFFEEIYFVPIVISHEFYDKKYLLPLAQKLRELKKEIIVIASSDFTHYGPNYGYCPYGVGKEAHKRVKKDDLEAIEYITRGDYNGFIDFYEEKGLTICGAGPIFIATAFAEKEGELLKYYTSAEITNNYSFFVGYASIIF